MFRPMIVGATVVLLLGAVGSVAADTVLATADTYVTVHGGLGGSESIHGADSTFGIIGALGSQATPLIQFDVSGLSGRTVVGNASLNLYLASSWNNATCTQLIDLYEEHSSWNEATTNWSNLPGPEWWITPPGPYGVTGPVLDSQTVTCLNGQPQTVSWQIPGSVVQSWIDNPTSNRGLVLVSQTTPAFQDLWFSSREGVFAPQLVFSAVPEPGTLVLFGIGTIALIGYGWRRRAA